MYLCITFIKIRKISDEHEMLQQRTQMIVIYLLAFLFCMLTALAIILMQPFMFRNVTFEGLAALFILDGLALTAGFLVVMLISVMIVKLT